jgi:hypothetical protein
MWHIRYMLRVNNSLRRDKMSSRKIRYRKSDGTIATEKFSFNKNKKYKFNKSTGAVEEVALNAVIAEDEITIPGSKSSLRRIADLERNVSILASKSGVVGSANSDTDSMLLTGNQTIAGTKTFSSTINGSISGNAATVTNGVYSTGTQDIGGAKTFTSTVTLKGTTPELHFNGTSDVGVDFAIKATPEGLDFYEPEDVNKVHFQILDDTGVNAVYGYKWNGVSLDDRYQAKGTYLTSYTETDTLDSVLARGATSGRNLTLTSTDTTTRILQVGKSTNGSQGTGAVEVTQDGSHGGGISYNGDGTPGFVSGEGADHITFYRMSAGTRYKVFSAVHNSNNVSFTGSITAAGDVTAYSDDSLKTNVQTIEGALGRVEAVRGVTFDRINDGTTSVGVIAQELEQVLPEAVHTDANGIRHVAYGNITGLLIEAVKELSAEVKELKKNK